MYAIIATGGKQYKVESGLRIKVERLESKAGDKFKFDVLMISDDNGIVVGNPIIAGAYAEAEVVKTGKDAKITVYKYKSKKNVRKRQGHRQPYTEVKITSIVK